MMVNWNGTIIGPNNTPFESRIHSLQIECGENYLDAPPAVKLHAGQPPVRHRRRAGGAQVAAGAEHLEEEQHHRGLPQRALHADAASELQEAPQPPENAPEYP